MRAPEKRKSAAAKATPDLPLAPLPRLPGLGEIGLDNFAPYLMNRVMARWNAGLAEDLRAMDVTTLKMRTLAVLSLFSSLTVNELAIYAVTEQSTISRTIDSLDEQGYIQRQPRSDDMRIRDISITAEGRAVFERIWPTMYAHHAQMFAGVSEEERRVFVSLLQKILNNFRKEDP